MRPGRMLKRSAAMALVMVILGGCASATPAPLDSIAPLVGKWSGTVDQGGGLQFFYLTIHADATFVATWGISWSYGAITFENGRASFQMSPPLREGTLRYYPGEGGGKPQLFMDALFASFHAVVTKGL
jgi:hypothetical protein